MQQRQITNGQQQPTEATEADYIQIAFTGNLLGMSNEQIWHYYKKVCEWLNLNPLSRPFDIIYSEKQKTKKLYPNATCAFQLASNHKLSTEKPVIEAEQAMVAFGAAVLRITVGVVGPDGRRIVGDCFLDIKDGTRIMSGLALENALKKGSTVALRRAILRYCGFNIAESDLPITTHEQTEFTVEDVNIPEAVEAVDIQPEPEPAPAVALLPEQSLVNRLEEIYTAQPGQTREGFRAFADRIGLESRPAPFLEKMLSEWQAAV